MKKATLITLLAVAIGQVVFGQSKPLMNWPMNKDTTANRWLTYQVFDSNHSDTTECWFKAAYIVSDNGVVERWTKGYVVKFPYKPITFSSLVAYRQPDNEYFLYSDKKRVNATVTAIIEK